MSKTALYVVGGAVLVGGLWWLSKDQSPYPLSQQAAAKRTAPTSVDVTKLGIAVAQLGGKALSTLDKYWAAKAQDRWTTTVSSSGDYGPLSSDNEFGTG